MCSRWSCSGCGYRESLSLRPECVEQECPCYKIPGSERRKTSVIFPFFSSKLWLTTWTFSVRPGAAMFSVGSSIQGLWFTTDLLLPLLSQLHQAAQAPCWCKAQAVLLKYAKLPSVFRNRFKYSCNAWFGRAAVLSGTCEHGVSHCDN